MWDLLTLLTVFAATTIAIIRVFTDGPDAAVPWLILAGVGMLRLDVADIKERQP